VTGTTSDISVESCDKFDSVRFNILMGNMSILLMLLMSGPVGGVAQWQNVGL